jgi:hypothetical protein
VFHPSLTPSSVARCLFARLNTRSVPHLTSRATKAYRIVRWIEGHSHCHYYYYYYYHHHHFNPQGTAVTARNLDQTIPSTLTVDCCALSGGSSTTTNEPRPSFVGTQSSGRAVHQTSPCPCLIAVDGTRPSWSPQPNKTQLYSIKKVAPACPFPPRRENKTTTPSSACILPLHATSSPPIHNTAPLQLSIPPS